jgi:hypothetical protein
VTSAIQKRIRNDQTATWASPSGIHAAGVGRETDAKGAIQAFPSHKERGIALPLYTCGPEHSRRLQDSLPGQAHLASTFFFFFFLLCFYFVSFSYFSLLIRVFV